MTSNLHPEARRVLDRRAESSRLPYHTLAVDAAREAFTDDMTADAPPPEVGAVQNLAIGSEERSLPIRIYTPAETGPHPMLVYFHGGAWVLGNLETHDVLCRELTRRASTIVIAVDYRKAPEHTFPAPIEDAHLAIRWAAANATYLDGEPDRIGVAGDSVGATIATAVSMLARESDGPALGYQLLIHPVTDSRVDTDSYVEYGSDFVGSRAGMAAYWDCFIRDEFDYANPYAAPLRAPSLEGLPPARVVTCEYDPLRDEGIAYAERLQEAGVLRDHTHEDDVFHGYVVGVEFMDRADEGVDDLAAGIREALHP
jgi:acetyl esterase